MCVKEGLKHLLIKIVVRYKIRSSVVAYSLCFAEAHNTKDRDV